MFDPSALAGELAGMPGVVAVVLGGSRAQGRERPDSDWDLGVYYDPSAFSVEPIRALGLPGQVFGLGEWSRLMDGGAWFDVDGVKVDLIYRSVEEAHAVMCERGQWVLNEKGLVERATSFLEQPDV